MKRIITFVLCLVMVFALSACKSEEARRVDKMIHDIGEVTLDSEEAISEAEHAVVALEAEDREQLDNVDKLKEKRSEYRNLVNKEKAEEVEERINNIGEVDLENTDKLNEAKRAYNALSKEAKELVSNYNIIEEAETSLSDLRVEKVIGLINNIGKVTKDSEDKINKAEEAYKDLSSEEQEKVTNYSTLTDAKSALTDILASIKKKDLEKKKNEALKKKNDSLAKLNKSYDDVTGFTFYNASVKPTYINDRSYVLPYLSVKDDYVFLFLQADYVGDDWVFYDTLIINADGQTYTVNLKYYEIDRETYRGGVCEFYNRQTKTGDEEWLNAIANAKKAVVRFKGDHHQYDLTVSESDKKGIKQVLAAYDAFENYNKAYSDYKLYN